MALTPDEIIAMARESGMEVHERKGQIRIGSAVLTGCDSTDAVMRFATLVAAKEREACAQVCDTTYYQFIGPEFGEVRHGIAACAAAIRAKEKP